MQYDSLIHASGSPRVHVSTELNGASSYRVEFDLSDDEIREQDERTAAEQLAVFGAERIAQDEANPASSEQADALKWDIERLCTDGREDFWRGVWRRQLVSDKGANGKNPLELMWNPAGIVGGFGVDRTWDGAVATISKLKQEKVWFKPDGSHVARMDARERLYIDPYDGMAWVRRVIYNRNGRVAGADKPANALEIQQARELLATLAAQQRDPAAGAALPVYLEIGYGLDPAAIGGQRTFDDKLYVGVERAKGEYENPLGEYSQAVAAETERLAAASSIASGKRLSFMIVDSARLPLDSGTVREAYLSNVLNAPLERAEQAEILEEVSRVLEPNGNVVTRVNWHQDKWPRAKMIELLRNAGLHVIRSVSHDESPAQYRQLELQYGTPRQVPAPEGYYLIAEPSRA